MHRSPVRVQLFDGQDLLIFIWVSFLFFYIQTLLVIEDLYISSGHTELYWISSLEYLLEEGTQELDGNDLHFDIDGPDGL